MPSNRWLSSPTAVSRGRGACSGGGAAAADTKGLTVRGSVEVTMVLFLDGADAKVKLSPARETRKMSCRSIDFMTGMTLKDRLQVADA